MDVKRWDLDEALGKSTDLLIECGERGMTCWALQAVLDEIIHSGGPWWLAHFLQTTPNETAAQALRGYLQAYWPAYWESVNGLMAATRWTRESEDVPRDFGED